MEETAWRPEAIDTCMKLGAGHPMGPLALLDFVGLDVAIAIGEAIGADVPERVRDARRRGRARPQERRAGFYDYVTARTAFSAAVSLAGAVSACSARAPEALRPHARGEVAHDVASPALGASPARTAVHGQLGVRQVVPAGAVERLECA